ncbi:cell envelope integrity protein CreD [Marinilabiliaceae bacterium JC017]|nr:cell envelope integrity protein CreD [Marinilabiliaceae bacterium JC017]
MEENIKQKMQDNWFYSITGKLVMIGTMVLILLIPLGMIKNLIEERQDNERQVDFEMQEQWGGAQTLSGPVLNIPVYFRESNKNGERILRKKWLHIMPEDLQIEGAVSPEIRYRGIYKKVLFNSDLHLKGHFSIIKNLPGDIEEIDWSDAYLTLGISDNRGIKGEVLCNMAKRTLEPEAGLVTNDLSNSGISFKLGQLTEAFAQDSPFDVQLSLSGSKGLYFIPLGKKTKVKLNSDWKDPSFTGSYLPVKREITAKGFTAEWAITHLNRNFPQQWVGDSYNIESQLLGVDLFVPVQHYQKSLRSVKYGMLIISLTILVFLFLELTKKKKIHIFQYFLVGLALVLFFSILTALSEHIGFTWAYLVATLGIVSMVSFYSYAILNDKKQALSIFCLLSIIYAFLFVLLQLNDYAFLAGNIGLFIALGVIMKASGKLSLSEQENMEQPV